MRGMIYIIDAKKKFLIRSYIGKTDQNIDGVK